MRFAAAAYADHGERVEAQRGKTGEAVATLAGNPTQEADEARAAIRGTRAGDWPAARDALARLAARGWCLPDNGMLDDVQASDCASGWPPLLREADDDATLASLRDKLGTRAASAAVRRPTCFRLLTAPPVRGTSDLPRARADLSALQGVADRRHGSEKDGCHDPLSEFLRPGAKKGLHPTPLLTMFRPSWP